MENSTKMNMIFLQVNLSQKQAQKLVKNQKLLT